MNRFKMDWTEDTDARLRELWMAEPRLSTSEIGKKIGATKNSIIRRSRRINLPPRGSPIIHKEKPESKPDVVVALKPKPISAPHKQFFGIFASPTACKWPIGNPGEAGFRFCNARRVPGKPYCAAHCEMAFKNDRNR